MDYFCKEEHYMERTGAELKAENNSTTNDSQTFSLTDRYLMEISEKIGSIKSWVTFWSVLTIIGMIFAIINVIFPFL